MQVSFFPDGLRLGVGYVRHAGPEAAALRSRFDVDGSGQLEGPEKDELALWLLNTSLRSFQIELDGSVVEPEAVDLSLTLAGDSNAVEGDSIEVKAVCLLAIALLPGSHELQVRDRPRDSRKVVPFRLDLPRGWRPEDIRATDEALPLTEVAEFSWQSAFAGLGGRLALTLVVPEKTETRSSGSPEAAESDGTQVGSTLEASQP